MLLVKCSSCRHLSLVQVSNDSNTRSDWLREDMGLLVSDDGLLLNKHFLVHLCLGCLILLLLNLLLRQSWLCERTHSVLWLLGSNRCRLRRMVVTLLRRTSVSQDRPTSQRRRGQLHQKLASRCAIVSYGDMVLGCCYSLWSVLTSIYKNTSCSIAVWLRHQVCCTWGRLFSEIGRTKSSIIRMLCGSCMIGTCILGSCCASSSI